MRENRRNRVIMREEAEGMQCFHVKPPKSSCSGTLNEIFTACAEKKAQLSVDFRHLCSFARLWNLEWPILVILLFQLQMWKLSHFFLSRVWCQLRVVHNNKTSPGWNVGTHVSHTHLSLPPQNWQGFSSTSPCWISPPVNGSDDWKCGSDNFKHLWNDGQLLTDTNCFKVDVMISLATTTHAVFTEPTSSFTWRMYSTACILWQNIFLSRFKIILAFKKKNPIPIKSQRRQKSNTF